MGNKPDDNKMKKVFLVFGPANAVEDQIVDEDPGYMEKLHESLSDWANERMNTEMQTDFSDSHND